MNTELPEPFPGSLPSRRLRAVALLGIIVPLTVLLPGWWGRPTLDKLTLLSYLACAAAPVPFGAWIGEAFGDFTRARNIMMAGIVLALAGGLASYLALLSRADAVARPPETLLVVPLAQMAFVLFTAYVAWVFGRR